MSDDGNCPCGHTQFRPCVHCETPRVNLEELQVGDELLLDQCDRGLWPGVVRRLIAEKWALIDEVETLRAEVEASRAENKALRNTLNSVVTRSHFEKVFDASHEQEATND